MSNLKDKALTMAAAALVMALGGCPSESSDGGNQMTDVPVDMVGVSGTGGGNSSDGAAGTGGDGAVDAGTGSSTTVDAGVPDAGGEADAGTTSSGAACCEASTAPGCADTATETCVCNLLPDCCTTAWDEACVQLVKQKFCEPGVRDCVCGPESEGGWEQTTCCEQAWTDFCADVASLKCEADLSCR